MSWKEPKNIACGSESDKNEFTVEFFLIFLLRKMVTVIKAYKNFLTKFPTISQGVQTGLLMGTGDLIAQTFVEKKSLTKIDLVRVGQFTLVGTLFVGPPLRIWYGAMDIHIGNTGRMVAVKKVILDQLIFAPPFMAAIMAIISLVQGNSVKEIKERLIHDYPDVLKNNYKLWPTVQLCNFYLVPLQFQVIVVQFVAIFWNVYLSWKMNKDILVLDKFDT